MSKIGGEFQVLIFPFTPLWRKSRVLNSLEGFYYALIKTIANNSIAAAIPERSFLCWINRSHDDLLETWAFGGICSAQIFGKWKKSLETPLIFWFIQSFEYSNSILCAPLSSMSTSLDCRVTVRIGFSRRNFSSELQETQGTLLSFTSYMLGLSDFLKVLQNLDRLSRK